MRIFFLFILLLSGILSIAQNKFGPDISFDTVNIDKSKTIALQKIIDKAQPGDYIKLQKAIYTGPIYIKKNGITIDGQGKSILTGLGLSSVIFIEADSVTVKNMVIQESGGSHDKIDCGVKIKGNFNLVENCRIKECLFGIDVFQSDNNKLFHNEISSLSRRSIALKGDAIRFWYSKFNVVGNNYWHGVRDMVVWYSANNLFIQNKGVGNRYSIHFMYAHNNRIQANEFYNNSVGVFLMYSEKTIMVNNLIQGSQGVSGMCLGMKETSSNQILNNRFIYSAQGIHFDVAPFVPEKINTIEGNEIAFCGAGMFFHTNQEGNLIKNNYFHNNLSQVIAEGRTASKNMWENNYFDDYQGFDRNKDNIGDTPYKLYTYVEHLWDFNKYVKFFYGAPILVVLDFLERLAPFSEPKFVLKDDKPMFFWKEKNNK